MIDAVLSIPSKIKDFRDDMVQKLRDIIDGILNLPEKIKDAIKALFLPSDGFIEGKIDHFRQKLLGMGVDTYDMGSIFSKEQPFEDITCTIRGQTVTIVRMDVVDKVVKKFRPAIRGFMWLMLVFYNYNQFMGFIGQKSLTLGGIIRTAQGKGETDG